MKQYILDTREPHEYRDSHVDGALNTPPQEFMGDGLPVVLADAAKDDEIVVYCRSGMRSNTVSQLLEMQGFTNIVNGINEHHVAKLLSERSE
ncbi:rhodanese-like domain-containing protein [Candidatus Saccharibacteria bacterium]|nr:rhodanese-like domain-containing protein [Candidatus Saccharibacteria bacterium]